MKAFYFFRLLFRWLAIPWLQDELNVLVSKFNTTPRKKNRRKLLPHGPPDYIFHNPKAFGSCDLKVICFYPVYLSILCLGCQIPVQKEIFNETETVYTCPDNSIFELVPPWFLDRVSTFYLHIGSPPIEFHSFWDVFGRIKLLFYENPLEDFDRRVFEFGTIRRELENPNYELLPGQRSPSPISAEPDMYANFNDEGE
jgi:hypothetical protein